MEAPASAADARTGAELCAFLDAEALAAEITGADPATSSIAPEQQQQFAACTLTVGIEPEGQIVMTRLADDFDDLLAAAPPSDDVVLVAGLGDRAVLSRPARSLFVEDGELLWLLAVRDGETIDVASLEAAGRVFVAAVGGRNRPYDPLAPEPLEPADVSELAEPPETDFCVIQENPAVALGADVVESVDDLRAMAARTVAVDAPAEVADAWATMVDGSLRLNGAYATSDSEWDALARMAAWEGNTAVEEAAAQVRAYATANCSDG